MEIDCANCGFVFSQKTGFPNKSGHVAKCCRRRQKHIAKVSLFESGLILCLSDLLIC